MEGSSSQPASTTRQAAIKKQKKDTRVVVQAMSTTDGTGMVKRDWQPRHGAFTLFERVEEDKTTTYWIKFVENNIFIPDPKGPSRGAFTRVLKFGERLSTEVMDPILRAQREVYPAIFKPQELVYVLAAGIPPLKGNDRLATKRGFRPDSHQVIVRIVHFEEHQHWSLLMHFISIETVLVWDAISWEMHEVEDEDEDEDLDDDKGIREENLSLHDVYTLDCHAAWTQGTIAEAKHKGGTRWKRNLGLGHGTQTDNWSCGLWCLARVEDLYRTLNERLAIDMQLDYEKVVGTLISYYCEDGARKIDLRRANSRLRLAHGLGYEVKSG